MTGPWIALSKLTSMKQTMPYSQWLQALEVLMGVLSIIKYPRRLCPHSWRMYYDEGLTPNQVIREDMGRLRPWDFIKDDRGS